MGDASSFGTLRSVASQRRGFEGIHAERFKAGVTLAPRGVTATEWTAVTCASSFRGTVEFLHCGCMLVVGLNAPLLLCKVSEAQSLSFISGFGFRSIKVLSGGRCGPRCWIDVAKWL